jgi:hypothetical protein
MSLDTIACARAPARARCERTSDLGAWRDAAGGTLVGAVSMGRTVVVTAGMNFAFGKWREP